MPTTHLITTLTRLPAFCKSFNAFTTINVTPHLLLCTTLATTSLLGVIGMTGCHKADSTKIDTKNTSQSANHTDTAAASSPSPLAKDEIQLLASDIVMTKTEQYQPSTTVTGTLQVANKTNVQGVVSAQATQILVKVGDTVRKGQPLVTLNLEDSKNKLAQAQSDVIAAQAQANVAKSLASRNKILLDKGFVAEIEYERTLADAKAQSEAVNAKQAQLNIAKKMYGDMTITAPMAGVIASRNVEAGQMVAAGQTLMQIVDPTHLEFAASVPNEAQAQVMLGQDVPFTVNNSNTKFIGQVSRIAPEVDASTRQMMIYITVKPAAATQSLRAGMFATGQINYGQAQVGILVPSNAVMLDDSADNKNASNGSSTSKDAKTTANVTNKPAVDNVAGANNALAKGYVWLVDKNQRLVRQPVGILKRYDNTNQYLISGVEMGKAVVLVPLAKDAVGKKVVVKT